MELRKLFIYPLKLAETASKINQMLPNSDNNAKKIDEKDIKKLIISAVNMNEKKIHLYANMLSDEDLDIIASYVSENVFNVNLNNLFDILRYKMNKHLFIIFYKGWLNNYTDPDLCKFLSECCDNNNVKTKEFIDKVLPCSIVQEWLKSDEIVESACVTAISYMREKSTSLDQAKENLSIYPSVLSQEISQVYYCICSEKEYLMCGDDSIVSGTVGYSENIYHTFILNFLNNVTKKNISSFPSTCEKIVKSLDDPHICSINYKKVFSEENNEKYPRAEDTYIFCYNAHQIDSIFGDQERGQFWKKQNYNYNFKYCQPYKEHQIVVMYFDDYIILESFEYEDKVKQMLSPNSGACYFFSVEYFDRNIRYYFGIYTKQEVKSRLYRKHVDVEPNFPCNNRHIHSAGWQYDFENALKKLNKRYIERPHTLNEKFKGKKIAGFKFLNIYHQSNSWNEMLLLFSKLLIKRNASLMYQAAKLNENFTNSADIPISDRKYYSRIKKTDIWVKTNLSADVVCKTIKSLLEIYNIPDSEFSVYLK